MICCNFQMKKGEVYRKGKATLLFILGVVLVRFILDKRSEKLLENSSNTLNIFAYYQGSSFVRSSGWTSGFKYELNGREYYLGTRGKINFLEKGDTVLIEYSIKDPSVAKVVDLYYMEKYKHLRDLVE